MKMQRGRRGAVGRRGFLRGAGGVALGLPFLETLHSPAQAGGSSTPVRLVIMLHPQGTILDAWTPSATGTQFDLPPALAPLEPIKDDIVVLSGLHNGVLPIIGNSGHGVAEPSLLTSMPMVTNIGPDGEIVDGYPPYSGGAGPSVDQVIAERLGPVTPYSTLDLALGEQTDTGFHFAGPDDPVTFEPDPRAVFERLFTDLDVDDPTPIQALRNARGSVLDAVSESFGQLRERVSAADRVRLDAHADKIRQLEERFSNPPIDCGQPVLDLPAGYYPHDTFDDVTAPAMIDMATMALACDMTRIVNVVFTSGHTPTFPWLGHDFAGQFPELGYWHELVHAVPGRPDVEAVALDVFRWYAEHFVALVQSLAQVPEGDGTMLDNTLVVWGSEFGDGSAHTSTRLPIVLAGRAGGQLVTGRHLDATGRTSGDLLVSILRMFGYDDTTFGWPGSSTGPVPGLV